MKQAFITKQYEIHEKDIYLSSSFDNVHIELINSTGTPSNSIDGQGGEGKAIRVQHDNKVKQDSWDLAAMRVMSEQDEDPTISDIAHRAMEIYADCCLKVAERVLLPQLTAAKTEADALRREVAELKAEKDTLRLWLAVGSNISNAAEEIVDVLCECTDKPGCNSETAIEEYIVTKMFKTYNP